MQLPTQETYTIFDTGLRDSNYILYQQNDIQEYLEQVKFLISSNNFTNVSRHALWMHFLDNFAVIPIDDFIEETLPEYKGQSLKHYLSTKPRKQMLYWQLCFRLIKLRIYLQVEIKEEVDNAKKEILSTILHFKLSYGQNRVHLDKDMENAFGYVLKDSTFYTFFEEVQEICDELDFEVKHLIDARKKVIFDGMTSGTKFMIPEESEKKASNSQEKSQPSSPSFGSDKIAKMNRAKLDNQKKIGDKKQNKDEDKSKDKRGVNTKDEESKRKSPVVLHKSAPPTRKNFKQSSEQSYKEERTQKSSQAKSTNKSEAQKKSQIKKLPKKNDRLEKLLRPLPNPNMNKQKAPRAFEQNNEVSKVLKTPVSISQILKQNIEQLLERPPNYFYERKEPSPERRSRYYPKRSPVLEQTPSLASQRSRPTRTIKEVQRQSFISRKLESYNYQQTTNILDFLKQDSEERKASSPEGIRLANVRPMNMSPKNKQQENKRRQDGLNQLRKEFEEVKQSSQKWMQSRESRK